MATFLVLDKPDLSVSFYFDNVEIPESIKWGGQQRLAVHEMVGGARVIDAMGATPQDLSWSGVFVDVSLTATDRLSSAVERARFLDYLRIAGLPLNCSWGGLSYSVVIESFVADYRAFDIPYTISCKTIQDNVTAVSAQPADTPDQAISDDMANAQTLTTNIADPTLTGLMGALQTAINAVSSFASASSAAINSVLVPIQAAQQQVQVLQVSASNTLLNIASLGGVAPYNPVSVSVARLVDQGATMTQSNSLDQLSSALGRMSHNVASAAPGANNTITVSGGTLYALAVKYYNDYSEWTTIAQANGLTDPVIVGTKTLVIPNLPSGLGGVANG